MKKVLLGSTALVAAAAVATSASARDVELSLRGFSVVGVGVGGFNEDGNDVAKDFHIIRDGEVQFRGSGTLDNGLTVTVRVELEAWSAGGSQIDESWVSVSGTFGELLIGGNDNAYYNIGGYTGNLGGPVGMASWDGSYDFVPAAGLTTNAYSVGGDPISVQYYIPNIAGFELGVSWTPTTEEDDSTDTGGDQENTNDQLAIGAAYTLEFENGSFTVGGGYQTHTDDDNDNEYVAWGVGAEIEFGAITIGARYESDDDEVGAALGLQGEAQRFGGGIVYATGPWEFGLNGVYEEVEPDTGSDFEQLRVNAGVSYEIGDGVTLGLGVDYGSVEFDDGSTDEDGFGGALLLGVNF